MINLKKLVPVFILAGMIGISYATEYKTKFDHFLNNENVPFLTADKKDNVTTSNAKSKTKYFNNQVFIAAHINFESGSAELSEDAKHIIDERVMRLQGKFQLTGKISIEGHSDHGETIVFGKDLSLERAKAVADYILEKATRVKKQDLAVIGLGSDAPILIAQSIEEKAQNRHVFIFAVGKALPLAKK